MKDLRTTVGIAAPPSGALLRGEVFRFDEGPEVIASRSLEHLRKTFS